MDAEGERRKRVGGGLEGGEKVDEAGQSEEESRS